MLIDFYYGDPYTMPGGPIQRALSKQYAADRLRLIDTTKKRSYGFTESYPYEGRTNPYLNIIDKMKKSTSYAKYLQILEKYSAGLLCWYDLGGGI